MSTDHSTVDAVDAAHMKEFDCAIPWREIKRRLALPVQKHHYQTKNKGGRSLSFVPWFHIQGYMEFATNGFYLWEVDDVQFEEERKGRGHDKKPPGLPRVNLVGKLTIMASDRTLIRMSTGAEFLDHAYGEPITVAEAQAFRRCCAKFGFCIHLWAGN